MGRKTLARMDEVADEEIINTPVLPSHRDSSDSEGTDADDDDEEAEAEVERQLVEEARREKEGKEEKNVMNKAALLLHAKELVNSELKWVETLDVCNYPLELENVHDDLKREVAFYNNSLAAVKHAKQLLKEKDFPYKRPEDYFAEMLKSDAHMAKVKDKLIYEQKKIATVEERKKSKEHKKVAKKVQSEKIKQRAQEKKGTLEALKQWKKRGRNNGGDDDKDLESVLQRGNKRKAASRGDSGKSFKRQAKDSKYGFGGPKRNAKQNDRESTDDRRDFRRGAGGKRSDKSTQNRPGKSRRQKMRAGK